MSNRIEIGAWIISGRVQGVGFRRFMEIEALVHGVSGWVRNLPDGSVEVVVAGSVDRVSAIRDRVAKGPVFARVDNVENIDVSHDISIPNSFEIR